MAWALQDAKAKFSEVVDRAITEGPQEVTRHGRPAVVIVEKAKFDDMVSRLPKTPKMTLGQFLLTIPQGGPDDLFDPIGGDLQDVDFGEPDE